MGLINKLRNELVDIIEWLDAGRSTLAWRFPRHDNEIKNGAELIVREGQEAVFVYRGSLADRFGPGHYQLVSENLPLLSSLQGWKHGFESPFRSEVYFVSTRPAEVRWGTPQPITIRDPDFRMVQVRANGLLVCRVADAEIFLKEVIGTEHMIEIDELTELLRRIIAQAFSEMVTSSGVGAIDLQTRQTELSQQLKGIVQERVDDEYGLEILSIDMTISLPEEVQDAISRGAATGAEAAGAMHGVGDMGRYQQFATADAMRTAADNPGGGGAMGDMLGMGMGLAMANQMAGTMGGAGNAGQAGGPPPAPSGGPAFHVDLGNGQQGGPFTVSQLQQAAAQGQFSGSTMVWSAGMAGWAPAQDVPALAAVFQAPPPPPSSDTPPPPPSGSGQGGDAPAAGAGDGSDAGGDTERE
jgi:membrane protease subunit (stomatin/prohibitin family)